jgi:hypothetical protein
MNLKLFQKQDLARAALKDGAILSWDTGLGKTWALYLWPLLKLGFEKAPPPDPGACISGPPEHLRPNGACLIIAPGDLHQQIADEGMAHFGVRTRKLDHQNTFMALTHQPGSQLSNLTPEGRPIVPAGFYITSYTQLTTNGVQDMPDPDKWEPRALLEWLALRIDEHVKAAGPTDTRPESFQDVCQFFAFRAHIWRDAFDLLSLTAEATLGDLEKAMSRAEQDLAYWQDPKQAEAQRERLYAADALLKNLCCHTRNPKFLNLNALQQDWVVREFCRAKITEYSRNIGETREYPIGPPPTGFDPLRPETDTRPKWRIKCVYSPTLADLCCDAFDCVVIDEGVKMKGEDTLVGKGVRSMAPKYRLVLTATPIKNRLPDIFRLAWWAAGGKEEAHARWPYRSDSSERNKFAETFMVAERNLSKEREARAQGKKAPVSRFKKLTAEVCNVHRLWKLFGPIILRRRKQDSGVDIVPKVRKVIRVEMGTRQQKVYQYHLNADYRDKNGDPAMGAQLQALRMAAADPTSVHLERQPGEPAELCVCRADPALHDTCRLCGDSGRVPLPHRSGNPYVPKMATALTLIHEILERKEQVIVFSAFNDPLDNLSRWLSEASVRHVVLDGRTSQKRRGEKAALFKKGRADVHSIPVMLAGVECMAEGHSFHRANNVILLAYSWAADKFKQALDRVHRLNSEKPVNVYVILCQGSIDRKLESLTDEKTDASELVLDGRLIGERSEEVSLAELLNIAKREFNRADNTLDEALLQESWPDLRDRLGTAMRRWDSFPESAPVGVLRPPALTLPAIHLPAQFGPDDLIMQMPTSHVGPPISTARSNPISAASPAARKPIPDWKQRMMDRASRLARLKRSDT